MCFEDRGVERFAAPIVPSENSLRVPGLRLYSAELINYSCICRKFLNQIGRYCDRILPILTQYVQIYKPERRRRVIRSGGARAVDVVHRLRPLFLCNSDIREADKSSDVVWGL